MSVQLTATQLKQLTLFEHAVDLPPHSRRQLESLRGSILEFGQLVPTVLWEHEGRLIILDGQTTLRLCQEELERRTSEPQDREDEDLEDAVDLQPKFEVFQGTPEQALNLFIARNFQRRSATQSQVAMFVAKRGFIPPTGIGPQTGRYLKVGEAAKRFAVSRTMLYEAGSVLAADPELAEQVMKGDISVGYAANMLRSRIWVNRSEAADEEGANTSLPFEDDEDQFEDDVHQDSGDDSEMADENEESDRNKSVVPSPFGRNRARITDKAVFDMDGTVLDRGQDVFIQALAECDRLERNLRENLAMLDSLRIPSFTPALRNAMRRDVRRRLDSLVAIRPAAICPSCLGASAKDNAAEPRAPRAFREGDVEDDRETEKGNCALCDGFGYLTAIQREHSETA